MPIDTLLSMNLLTSAAKMASSEGISTVVRLLADRAKEAEQRSITCVDPNGSLGNCRDARLRQIADLRNRAALCIKDADLQQRILCVLMEQSIATFEAKSQSDLDFVSANLQHVAAAMDSYARALANRQHIRVIAVMISILSLISIGAFLYIGQHFRLLPNATVPMLGVPTGVLLWSVIGSFAAILYRFSNAGDIELEDPLRWLFSRPLTGIIMGAITYLILKTGLITLSTGAQPNLATNEVMWLVAFLAGFSDRFSDTLLRSMVGRFGGDKTGDLISTQAVSTANASRLMTAFTGLVKRPNDPTVVEQIGVVSASVTGIGLPTK